MYILISGDISHVFKSYLFIIFDSKTILILENGSTWSSLVHMNKELIVMYIVNKILVTYFWCLVVLQTYPNQLQTNPAYSVVK